MASGERELTVNLIDPVQFRPHGVLRSQNNQNFQCYVFFILTLILKLIIRVKRNWTGIEQVKSFETPN